MNNFFTIWRDNLEGISYNVAHDVWDREGQPRYGKTSIKREVIVELLHQRIWDVDLFVHHVEELLGPNVVSADDVDLLIQVYLAGGLENES